MLPGTAPRYAGPQDREAEVTEIYTRLHTGGSLGLLKQTIAPKSGPPTHVHLTEDEFFCVMKGDFKVKLGDRIMDAPVGTVMFVPRGVAHAFQNAGNEPGEFLVGVMPGGFEGMMVERHGQRRRQSARQKIQHGSGWTDNSIAVPTRHRKSFASPRSSANSSGTRLGQQHENDEKPATDCRYSCSHIGPSSSPQDLLNSSYLLIALDNVLAHQ